MRRNGVLGDVGRIFVAPIGRGMVNVFPVGQMFLVRMFLSTVND